MLAHGYKIVSGVIVNALAFGGGGSQKLLLIWTTLSSHSTPIRGQLEHEPSKAWYVFAGHRTHTACASFGKAPTVHCVQLSEPESATECGGQSPHSKASPKGARCFRLPAGQGMHCGRSVSPTRPPPQRKHAEAPERATAVGWQALQ
jgi:hypothetical protein